jgi:hypothetical protein
MSERNFMDILLRTKKISLTEKLIHAYASDSDVEEGERLIDDLSYK